MIMVEVRIVRKTSLAIFIAAGFLGLAGMSTPTSALARLVGKPAPEISNNKWIHSEPLRLKDLKGKVVLLEFWTYG